MVGQTLEDGLPNITGTSTSVTGNSNPGYYAGPYIRRKATGGFRTVTRHSTALFEHSASWSSGNYLDYDEFNASYSNPIYGNSTVVQPKTYIVRHLIRAKA